MSIDILKKDELLIGTLARPLFLAVYVVAPLRRRKFLLVPPNLGGGDIPISFWSSRAETSFWDGYI